MFFNEKLHPKASEKMQTEKVTQLEQQLKEERDRAERLEKESNRCFEAEEQLTLAKEELDMLRSELAKTQVQLTKLTDQNFASEHDKKVEGDTLHMELDALKILLETKESLFAKQLEEKDSQTTEAQSKAGQLETQVSIV
jgi:hypothetical protein